MKYYPVFLRLEGRPCVVVGGGPVAERKVGRLLGAGAALTVVSPSLTPVLMRLAADGRIRHRAREYREGDLDGAALAFAATGDECVDGAVAREAARRGIMTNVVDRPEHCSFIVPSVVERGDLVIATSTGGASPLLARRLREHLEAQFGPEYGPLLEILRRLRVRLAEDGWGSEQRRRVFAALLESPLLSSIRAGDRMGVNRVLAETVGTKYTLDDIGCAY